MSNETREDYAYYCPRCGAVTGEPHIYGPALPEYPCQLCEEELRGKFRCAWCEKEIAQPALFCREMTEEEFCSASCLQKATESEREEEEEEGV